jgi:F-type H+-transporting ATPase subunit delta
MTINRQAKRKATQLFRLCMADGRFHEDRVRQVVRRTIAARHRQSPAILAHFLRLVRLEIAQRTAIVESAAPVTADLQAATEANLTRRYGPGLRTAFVERPDLIGGMRIQIGSDVYDGSVLGRLAALENSF